MRYLRFVLIAALLAVAPTFCLSADLQIVFYSDREGREIAVGQREREVFVMNPDGSNPVNLTKQIGVDRLPSVSPDKTKYLFSSNRTGDNEIFAINVDGSNLVNLTNDPAASDSHARWSRDGTQVVWSRRSPDAIGETREIFVMNLDGSNKRNLGDGYKPEWSPDGRMIGFNLQGVHDNAFVMNADGSARRRVTDELFPSRFISWSRDGTKIAFDHRKHFGFVQNKIYIVNVDGTGLFELTKVVPEIDSYGAAWSPDGSKIAFSTKNWNHIYVVNSDGTNLVNLTNHHPPAIHNVPLWSPDGREIVFQTNRDGNWELYIMNADGSNPVNLTNHPAVDHSPSWIRSDYLTTSVSPQDRRLTSWGRIKRRTH